MSNNKTLPTPNPRRSTHNTPVLIGSARAWRWDKSRASILQPVRTVRNGGLGEATGGTQTTGHSGCTCPRSRKRNPPEQGPGPPVADGSQTNQQLPHDLQPEQRSSACHKASACGARHRPGPGGWGCHRTPLRSRQRHGSQIRYRRPSGCGGCPSATASDGMDPWVSAGTLESDARRTPELALIRHAPATRDSQWHR